MHIAKALGIGGEISSPTSTIEFHFLNQIAKIEFIIPGS